MERKNVILLTVIAVATLLITVVGATFAYYVATIDNSKNEVVDIKAAKDTDLAITYNDGSAISVTNIIPGWNTSEPIDTKGQKTITITNTGNVPLKYQVHWYDVKNGFAADKDNFKYSINGSSSWQPDQSGTSTTDFSSVNKDYVVPTDSTGFLVQDIEIQPHEIHTYVVTFKYENAATDQKTQGATFTAQFTMTDDDVQAVYKAS